MQKKTLLGWMLWAAMTVSAQTADYHIKMSPYLRSLVQAAPARRAVGGGDGQVDVLAKLGTGADEATVLQRYGARLKQRIGSVLIVTVPFDQVAAMAADAGVQRLEAERMPRPLLDRVPSQTGADKVLGNTEQTLPQAFTGKGVVVGIVDSGFDAIHPMFRDSTGRTRVVWAKDYMTGQTYASPDEVTAAMHSSDALTMYHGTHVAGIAAGSQVSDADLDQPTTYSGIAREADIAEGAVNSAIGVEGLSSASTIQAFADIFELAAERGQPCVINYSLGDAMTFSSSRQLEEEAIRTLLQQPGRALVVASGNAGGTARLAHKAASLAEGGAGVCFNDYEQYGTYFGIEVKVKPGQTVRLRYTDSSYTFDKASKTLTTADLQTPSDFMLGNKRIFVQPKEPTADGYVVAYLTAGTLTTFTTIERILVTIGGEGEAWLYADPLCAMLENVATVENHALAQAGYSVAWPAQMDEVVSVGNIAHRLQIVTTANKYASQGGQVEPTDLTAFESTKGEGFLARSSSVGPTLTGAMKPDVCAPGVNIVSAQNFFIDDNTYYSLAAWDVAALDTDYEEWGGLQGFFHMMAQTGTSMSAPAVAGIIALWLQADPTLTTERIKDVIAHSARQPDATLTYPNNQYGHGEIDAYRGLLYILGLTGISELSQSQPRQTQIRLEGRTLRITLNGDADRQPAVRIFSTDGRLLLTTTATTVDLSHLPAGVYAVQVTTGQKATTGSTLIRL